MTTEVKVYPPNNTEVRRWAEAKGLPVSSVGKMPYGLFKAWDRAHPDRPYVKSEAHHGTWHGYAHMGCRCDRCVEVALAMERDRKRGDREDREWEDNGAL